jgi:hypothetical protein
VRQTQVNAYFNIARLATEITFFKRELNQRFVAAPVDLVFSEAEANEPTLRLEWEDAQELFQALWDANHRPANGSGGPANGSGGAAEVDALKSHIKFAERVVNACLTSPEGA